MQTSFPNLFHPISIGSMELKNRVVLAPMGTGLAHKDDTMSDRMISFYTRIAEGGTGLITTGVAAVSKNGTVGVGMNSLYHDRYVEGFAALADSVHAAGAKLSVHLMHGGLEGYPFFTRGKRLVSPSGGTFRPNLIRFRGMNLEKTTMPSCAMNAAEIRQVVEDFAKAAARAKLAGADAVELNGAQGFLLQQFYSPYFNKRTDEYGGDFKDRMRFPLEVVEGVRSVVGADFPIIFRMVATEGQDGSIDTVDAAEIARALEKAGVDALHITAGRGISPDVWSLMMPIAEEGHAPIIDRVGQIKKAVGIPVIGVQRIVDPRTAEIILSGKKADMVALGRGLIADPDWVAKAENGREREIRKCIGCLQGCIGTQMTAGFAECLQNPEVGLDCSRQKGVAGKSRKVLVIGGGPAGLEAALTCGIRGHDVVLCEKEMKLGGQWNLASVPPGKADFRWVVDWRVDQIRRLPNVEVVTGCEVDPEMVRVMNPEVVFVATGSVPVIPMIPGADGSRVMTAHDVLAGLMVPGKRVAVIGGGATGCETANYLAEQGKRITLVEALPDVATDEAPARKVWLMKSLSRKNVVVETGAPVQEITETGEIFIARDGRDLSLGVFDAVVLAAGVRSHDPLSAILGELSFAVHVVGDAYVMPTNGLDAIRHAFELAGTV